MAIQNFLSGGYYGKLGATVGQRWKNKRTIRTYVVPANPRTPTQQANRNKFANAVIFAQMGMQMNYYCTLFDDPNFTKWNYRMKVARELKNAGLTDLDLIPLYPTSFNPPTLITEFTKDTVTGTRHISFAVPDLALNTDRVLSLMFAIYNENDVFLGYKLYLGYYYASNPGYVEVDVDDVNEINSHCFVRTVSNDDEDSSTDLIGSPRLQVGGSTIDIHDFDTTIRSLSKNASGITITFNELWKGVPTVNTITATASFVSNGDLATATLSAGQLFENNGYCAITIPYATSDNQHLPAFPNGSQVVVSAVDYEGSSWQITNEDKTEAYSDSDLTRQVNASPSWNSSDTGDITFRIAFGGTVAATTKNYNMVCSGRLDARNAVSQGFNVVGTDEYLVFTCTGNLKRYPMKVSGDKITLTATTFVCNGVSYVLPAQDVALRNAITKSYWLRDSSLTVNYYRDGGSSVGDELYSLSISIFGITMNSQPSYNSEWIARINTVNGHSCIPLNCTMELDTYDPSDPALIINADFDGADYNDDINTNCRIVSATVGQEFDYGGITYYFPNLSEHEYIGDWSE